MKLMTYNFCLDDGKYPSHQDMIRETLRDKRNDINTTNIIPNTECYINYLELLTMFRDKWYSVGYLDLGMIPIIMGPSFMHDLLVQKLMPLVNLGGLPVYSLPSVSFMCRDTMKSSYDYWAFRDDVGEFLGKDPMKVTSKEVIIKLMGG